MSEKYSSTGTVIALLDTNQVSDKFKKREFVLEIPDGKYPQKVLFQTTGDRIAQLDEVRIGDTLAVDWNLRGRAWDKPGSTETKYFVSLEAWKIEVKAKGKPQEQVELPGAGDDDSSIPF